MARFQQEVSASLPGGLTFQSHLQQYASYTQAPPWLRPATVIGDFRGSVHLHDATAAMCVPALRMIFKQPSRGSAVMYNACPSRQALGCQPPGCGRWESTSSSRVMALAPYRPARLVIRDVFPPGRWVPGRVRHGPRPRSKRPTLATGRKTMNRSHTKIRALVEQTMAALKS